VQQLEAFADGRFDVAIVDILLEDAMGYDDIAAPAPAGSGFARCCRLRADVA
jgi:hypothetical protein